MPKVPSPSTFCASPFEFKLHTLLNLTPQLGLDYSVSCLDDNYAFFKLYADIMVVVWYVKSFNNYTMYKILPYRESMKF